MSVLLQVKNLYKSHGARMILEDASVSFLKGQKVGMIGRNGAGKSTLCRIITGQEEMDSGTVTKNSELRLSYLEQQDPFLPDETVLDFLVRYTHKEEWQCAETAAKFQLKHELLGVRIAALAGGYQTRVKLSAMLLNDPNFLVLDEPSNYLDLSTLILLENFLLDFNGGFLIVSHDREFLKRTCEHTLEVENGNLTLYPGDIEEHFQFKEEQLAQKMAYNKTIEKKKEQLQLFIDRFKAKASTATRAKSKVKQLQKLKTIEIAHPMSTVKIRIPEIERKAGVALSCEDLNIGYPEKIVAQGIRMDIDRGAHVAVLGDNGQGKTTFLRTIAGELTPKAGSFQWGTALRVAYYAQHVFSKLHPQDDVFSHLQREAAVGVTTQDILNLAGCFLFQGDDVKKKVSILSGGECARLCLAGLLLSKSHVLLLDEPTNHLDFETVEALGRALKEFAGTVFFISHDRTFVNLLGTNILEVKNGTITRYPGTYEDYVYHLESWAREEMHHEDSAPAGQASSARAVKRKISPETEEDDEGVPPSSGEGGPAPEEGVKKEGHPFDRKRVKAEMAKIRTQMVKSEKRIEHFTGERKSLLDELANNPFHYSRKRNDRIKELTARIEEEEELWLRLQSMLDKLGKEIS